MSKHIKFVAASESIHATEDAPKPSSHFVPDWFKSIPAERSKKGQNFKQASTVKKCVPFMDAFTMGYTLALPQDIGFSNHNGSVDVNVGVDRQPSLLELDPVHRTEGLHVPDGYSEVVFRINLQQIIETPKGYSLLVTHPLNRFDLPFLTFSGVVDTDVLSTPITVSLRLKQGFTGILEKGTPLAQVIPIKRETWDSSIGDPYSSNKINKINFDLNSRLNRSYQLNFWNKKRYL
jgi:hypothetical protein